MTLTPEQLDELEARAKDLIGRVVYTDCGGMFMWTSFASWRPTDEPDVVLSDDYRAMRESTPTTKGRL